MPYDIVDAFTEIKELQQMVLEIVNTLQEQHIMKKPKPEPTMEKKENV